MTYLCLHQTQYVTCHAHLTPNAAQLHWSMNPILGSKLPGLHKIQRQNPIRRDWKRRICETTNQCLLVGCQPSEFAWICDSFLLPHPFWGPQKFWATPRSVLPGSIVAERRLGALFSIHFPARQLHPSTDVADILIWYAICHLPRMVAEMSSDTFFPANETLDVIDHLWRW